MSAMSGALNEFLSGSKAQVANASSSNVKFHVVLGNEACDLDTAACSIAVAYFLHATDKTKGSTIYVPLLNIHHSEYRLKTEVKYLLNKLNVAESSILFKEDIDMKTLCTHNRLKLTLVDFNIFPKEHDYLEKCVRMVIDHHVKRRKINFKVRVIIETVGSCASLVTEHVTKQKGFHLPSEIATLLYGAILIDTVYLKDAGRTTEKDVKMVERLEMTLKDLNIVRKELYSEILEAKVDVTGLTHIELLNKDLKLLKRSHKEKSISFAIPVVNKCIYDFFGRDFAVEDLFKEILDSTKSDVLIIMFLQILANIAVRHLCVYSTNEKLLNQVVVALTNHTDPYLNLEQILITPARPSISFSMNPEESIIFPTISSSVAERSFAQLTIMSKVSEPPFMAFKQGNTSASRKVVMPVLENYFDAFFKCM